MRSVLTRMLLVLALLSADAASAQTVVCLNTRPDVQQSYLWLPAPDAVATVVLMVGGTAGSICQKTARSAA